VAPGREIATMTTKSRPLGFSIAQRLRSFRYAASGIVFMLRTQHNAWIHLAITVAVLAFGWRLGLSGTDWRWITVAIVLVWVAETMNTAFEFVCDVVSPEFHISVKTAKDIAAGAVLICSAGAVVIGLLTLWPYLSA
jgi:diacylglycerol kinase (ATP)